RDWSSDVCSSDLSCHFFRIRLNRFPQHWLQWTNQIAVKVLFNLPLELTFGYKVLDQPVFQRMVTHHHQPAVFLQQLGSLHQHFFQSPHLIIHGYSNGLEYLSKIFKLPSSRREAAEDLLQLRNGV